MTTKRIMSRQIESDFEYAQQLIELDEETKITKENEEFQLTKKFLKIESQCDYCSKETYSENNLKSSMSIRYLNMCNHKICFTCLKNHIFSLTTLSLYHRQF